MASGRTVVVGVDTSAASANALKFASSVCKPGDKVHIAFCYSPLADFVGPEFSKSPTEAQHQAWKEKEEAEFSRFLAENPVQFDDVCIEKHILAGDPRQMIPLVAEQQKADHVVVGSHGRGFLGRAILGSVSTYLSQHATQPITVVPKDYTFK